MLKIFCDETWTSPSEFKKTKKPTIVFYGVMLDELEEERLLNRIKIFKEKRGLLPPTNSPVEIKWQKVENEWKESNKTGKPNRSEEFLDIFFEEVKSKRLSFGYMFLDKREYDKIEQEFLKNQNDNKQNFFFMLYFHFLFYCFIKNLVKQQPCKISIDNHDMGGEGQRYEIDKLKRILNKKIFNDYTPKGQKALSLELQKQLVDSIQYVSLADSKDEPLVQLADLCAGCIRYILENQIDPPLREGQLSLFESAKEEREQNGKENLSRFFYSQLRQIKGYENINLNNISYHYRFNIFPFSFGK